MLLFLILVSCEKAIDWDFEPEPGDKKVVNALFTDERKNQQLSISYSIHQPGQIPVPIKNASVVLSSDDSLWIFKEDSLNPGSYMARFALQSGVEYTLVIALGDEIITARESLAEGREFDPPVFVLDPEDNRYYIDRIGNPFDPQYAAMYEVIADWSQVPGFESTPVSECQALLYFYTLPTLDVSQLLPPPLQKTGFPAGSRIDINRYSLTPSHAEYIRQVLLETSWSGGLWALEPANVPTNLSGNALGYMGLCGKTSLSLFL